MPALTEKNYQDDLLRYEVHPGFCRGSITYVAPGDLAVGDQLLGTIVDEDGEELLKAGLDALEPGDIIYIVLDDNPLAEALEEADELTNVLVLKRGPAMVHKDYIKATDSAGVAFDADTWIAVTACLLAMPGPILVVTEQGVYSTGSS